MRAAEKPDLPSGHFFGDNRSLEVQSRRVNRECVGDRLVPPSKGKNEQQTKWGQRKQHLGDVPKPELNQKGIECGSRFRKKKEKRRTTNKLGQRKQHSRIFKTGEDRDRLSMCFRHPNKYNFSIHFLLCPTFYKKFCLWISFVTSLTLARNMIYKWNTCGRISLWFYWRKITHLRLKRSQEKWMCIHDLQMIMWRSEFGIKEIGQKMAQWRKEPETICCPWNSVNARKEWKGMREAKGQCPLT